MLTTIMIFVIFHFIWYVLSTASDHAVLCKIEENTRMPVGINVKGAPGNDPYGR